MARPFRFRPPDVADELVLRERLQSGLAGRFDRRVTVVVGGAGFGKTTALVQAFAENELRPLGRDIWLACEDADGDPEHFARAIATVIGLDGVPTADELAGRVSEAIGRDAPQAVCLVLDDVQFLGAASGALLDRLIAELPSNGHLVFSGRTMPPLTLTRLELIGECRVFDESALALDRAQVAELFGTEEAEVGDEYGGWPALLQLARAGRARMFVEEEILRSLTDEEHAVLRHLAVLGEIDPATLDELVGADTEPIMECLPLVHRRGDRWAAHDLWSELLGGLDEASAERIRRRTAEVLLERGAAVEAVDVLVPVAGSGGDALVGRALRDALLDADRLGPEVLRRWSATWPVGDGSDEGVQPARLLLGGLIERLDNPGSARCHELLRSAADGFLGVGDGDAAVSALGSLVYAYHVRRDVEGLLWAFGELGLLSERGIESARPFPLLGRALVATSASDPAAVVEHTEPLLALDLGDELRAIALWLHANALANLGRSSVEPARACHEIGLPLPGIAMIHSGARWRAGEIRDLLAHPTVALDGERDRFLAAAWSACVHAAIGDLAESRRQVGVVESSSSDVSQWQTAGSVVLPRATLLVAEGREEEAADVLADYLAATPPVGQGAFYRLFALGLVYLLLPEERPWIDEQAATADWGPLYQRDIDLVRALVAVRERGDVGPAQHLRYPGAEEMMPAVGLRHGAVLLAAAVGAGRDDLGELLDDWVDLLGERARRRWRELAGHPVAEVADGARRILEALPVRPRDPRRLSVLGTTELLVGGHPVEAADWRRERVRALLTYLVLHCDTTREAAMAALWPEASETSARRSLRTTLSMLHDVLEPARTAGDAPYFVRSAGQRLRLVVSDGEAWDEPSPHGLLVDVHRFEELLDRAERLESAGTPSKSIAPRLDALSLYRGDLLPDCYDDWAVFERDRLRSRYVAAGVRAAELLIATGDPDRAVGTVTPILSIEPWSEPAHRAVIAAHLERGDLAAARRCLATCERSLAELGGPSEPATSELVRRLARR